jgi:prepilin-type processing-associated H-X9-DG protein
MTVTKRKGLEGFTLLELLIVIAIIMLLAAILFPVFARARENARRASCQSNLHQIGLAMTQYVQDNDGRYPTVLGDKDPDDTTQGTWWPEKIYPYVKNAQVFLCPSDLRQATTQDPASMNPDVPKVSYGMEAVGIANWTCSKPIAGQFANPNMNHGAWFHLDGSNSPNKPALDSDVALPATTIMVCEIRGGGMMKDLNMWNDSHLPWGAMTWTATNLFGQHIYTHTEYVGGSGVCTQVVKADFRHFESGNLLYADGHVKWRRYDTLKAADWTLQDD